MGAVVVGNNRLPDQPANSNPRYKLGSTVHVYAGDFVVVTLSGGTAGPAQDTDSAHTASSSFKFVGVSEREIDNSAGLAPSASPTIPNLGTLPGTFQYITPESYKRVCVPFDSVAATDVGKKAYAINQNTASITATDGTSATSRVYVGHIVEYVDSSHAFVDIRAGVNASPA